MKKNRGLFLLFVSIVISFGLIACDEGTQKKPDDKSKTEENNVENNTEKKPEQQNVSTKNTHPELSEDDIINLVESIDPYELKPVMTEEERYNLRDELYQNLSDEERGNLSDTIIDLSLLLTGTVADDLYKNLINTNDPKWEALEESNCYYAREKLDAIKNLVSNHQPLVDDLNSVIKLCEEGVEKKDVLKIVDARRILFDISNHLFQVPFTGAAEKASGAVVEYGDLHDTYFKASKTLEGSHNLISN